MNFTNKQLADKKLAVCDWDLGPGARTLHTDCGAISSPDFSDTPLLSRPSAPSLVASQTEKIKESGSIKTKLLENPYQDLVRINFNQNKSQKPGSGCYLHYFIIFAMKALTSR